MKFILDRDPLLSALTRTGGIVARRHSIPILSNVLLDAWQSLTMRATDLDIEAVMSVECQTEQPGVITVPAANLLDIARSLPEGAQLKCELVEHRLNVSAGRARWKLPTLGADMFPDMGASSTEWTWEQTITGAEFADLIARTSWAISTDASKQFLGGVRLSCDGSDLVAMATESHIMAIARMACPAPEFAGVTIPGKTCAEIVKLCEGMADTTLRMTEAKIGVETSAASLTSKVIGLEFPSRGIAGVLAVERPHALVANRNQLGLALRRAMIGTNPTALGHYVKITIAAGEMSVTGRSADSEAADEIEIEYDGPEMALGFNSEWLSEMIAKMKSDAVTLHFNRDKPTMPFLIQVAGDDSIICIGTPQKMA